MIDNDKSVVITYNRYHKSYMRNPLVPKWMTLTFV